MPFLCMSTQDSYARRGVSSGKEDVHKAIQNLDKGLVPGAFCKVLPDLIAQVLYTIAIRISGTR